MKALPYKAAVRTCRNYVEVAVKTVYNINIHIACFKVAYEGNILMNPGLIRRAPEPTAQKMRPYVMMDDGVAIPSDIVSKPTDNCTLPPAETHDHVPGLSFSSRTARALTLETCLVTMLRNCAEH